MRLLIFDYADVGRDREFTIGKGVESLLHRIGIGSGRQINEDFYEVSGVILYALYLDFTLFIGRDD